MTLQCYRGRSRTSRRPRVSGHAGYIRSIAASCKLKPFGGCNLDQIATTAMVSTHVPLAAAFQTQAWCCLRDACIPYASHKEHAACRRASRREQAGRGRPVLKATCEHPGRAFTIRNMPDVARASWAHSRPIPIRDQ